MNAASAIISPQYKTPVTGSNFLAFGAHIPTLTKDLPYEQGPFQYDTDVYVDV